MKNLNLPPFYPGQKVVCINPGSHSLILGKIYIVNQCLIECDCGWVVSIEGVKTQYSNDPIYELDKCEECGCTMPKMDLHTFFPFRFAPLQQQKFPLMTFSEIKVKEQEEILIDN